MTGLLGAELRKLWTLRTTWVLTAIGIGLVALSTGELVLGGAGVDAEVTPLARTVTAVALIGNNSIIVLVVALLIMTTEFRHRTVGTTLLLTPSRTRVLLAKLCAGGLYAGAFFAVSLALVAVLVLLGSWGEASTLLLATEVVRSAWHGLVGLVLTGILGVAVGALIRSQVVAITASLAWLFLIENLAAALHYGIGRWLPFQALNAVFLGDAAEAIEPGLIAPLAPGLALLVFLAYVLSATAAAAMLMTVRDV